MRKIVTIVFLIFASLFLKAEAFVPIGLLSDLQSGDSVMVVLPNRTNNTIGYALAVSNAETNAQTILINDEQIISPDRTCVWCVTQTNPFRIERTAVHPLNVIDDWSITSVIGTNYFQMRLSNSPENVLAWSMPDNAFVLTSIEDDACAVQLYKRAYNATFNAGHYGRVLPIETQQWSSTNGNFITFPQCITFSAKHPFLGWSMQQGSQAYDYVPGQTVSISQDVTFYAVYGTNELNSQCFDFTDLYSDYVTCRYGARNNDLQFDFDIRSIEWEGAGVREGNPFNANTHINVITDPNARCSLIPPIHEIPPGKDKSIRLGNYTDGWGAEDVEYTFFVDTTQNPLLLIQYLPVLETSHDGGAGVELNIWDENGQLVDKECVSFAFSLEGSEIVGSMPGNPVWKNEGGYLYHDWATIGVDLSPYHGQTLVVVLTTYDCAAGAHRGFCYYNISCHKKNIDVFDCSNDGNQLELHAPDGFFYRWYPQSEPTNVFSTKQTTTIPEGINDSIFCCDMAGDSGFKCKFTVSTKATPTYAVAKLAYEQRHGICADTIYLHNLSFASPNGIDELPTHIDCDSAWWYVDDAQTLSHAEPDLRQYNFDEPLIFTTPGEKTIKLKVCRKNQQCSVDSTEIHLNVIAGQPYQITYDTICLGDSITIFGKSILPSQPGNHVYYNEITNADCSSLIRQEEHLFIAPRYEFTEYDTICENQSFIWHNKLVEHDGVYRDSLITQFGCDSVYNLLVTYIAAPFDSTFLNRAICEGETYWWDGYPYRETGQYTRTYTNRSGCDSIVILDLYVRPAYVKNSIPHLPWLEPYVAEEENDPGFIGDPYITDATSEEVEDPVFLDDPFMNWQCTIDTICQGQTYLWQGKNYFQTGVYADTLQSSLGCDSVIYLCLLVQPTYFFKEHQIINQGEQYIWYGHHEDIILSEAGIYFDSLQTVNLCDSIYQLQLYVNTKQDTYITDTICEHDVYTWHIGERDTLISTAGTYTATIGNDSILHLLLFESKSSFAPIQSAKICQGDSILWHGKYYSESGTYYDTTVNALGCDSIECLYLVTNTPNIIITEATICEGQPFEWQKRQYTTSIDDTIFFKNQYDCDSLCVLHLNVQPILHQFDTVALCEEDSFYFYGQYLSIPGDYYQTLTSLTTSCDSVYHLHLIQKSKQHITVYDTICTHSIFRGNQMDVGDYVFVDSLNVYGCDSIVTTFIHVAPNYFVSDSVHLCNVDTYLWHTKALSISGVYYDTLVSISGCDSICQLKLSMGHSAFTLIFDTICRGNVYTFSSKHLTKSGTYKDTLTTWDGCDSVVELRLFVIEPTQSEEICSMCEYDLPYHWNEHVIYESGTYTTHFTSQHGCDSTAILHFNVIPAISHDTVVAVCAHQLPYLWHGKSIATPQVVFDTITHIGQCPDIYKLTLLLNKYCGEDYPLNPEAECGDTTYSTTDTTLCDEVLRNEGVLWFNKMYYEQGTYHDTLIGQNYISCDSIGTLILRDSLCSCDTIRVQKYQQVKEEQLPYAWNDFSLSVVPINDQRDTTAVYITPAASGCDSITTLYLHILAPCEFPTKEYPKYWRKED